MRLVTNDEKLYDELLLIIKLFYTPQDVDSLDLTINHNYTINVDKLVNYVEISGVNVIKHERIDIMSTFMFGAKLYKYLKRFAKLALYESLSKMLNRSLPWGALTGIRPTKLLSELAKEEGSLMIATSRLKKEFYVREDKAELCADIIRNQKNVISKNDKLIDFYVHIPFCPSRCNYCSFISNGLDHCSHLLEPYLDALIKDIKETKRMLDKNCYIVKTVYIGGGTPTVLSAPQLDRLLDAIGYKTKEFTVESGRPDTFTKEKLDVLKAHGVSRICINPQTFSNRTLKNIGRGHTAEQVIDAYKLALPYNFEVNMDLIAGLDGESFATFKKSLNKVIEMSPHNITVHTLSVKRASRLHEFNETTSKPNEVDKMVDYSAKVLYEAGYKPYYLYRQKNMVGNLENVGYFRDGAINVFNVDSMEDISSIVACGAGAVSKRYYVSEDRIERFGQLKNIKEYIERIDEMIDKKNQLFS